MEYNKLIVAGLILTFGALLVTGCISEENLPGNETETEYKLTMNIEGEGSTNPAEGNHTYQEGEKVTVKAEPEEEWMFVRWEGDQENMEKQINITMNEDKNLKPVFIHLNQTGVKEEHKEDIKKAINYSKGKMCTEQYKKLESPDGEFTYGASDGCQISYLEQRNWTEPKNTLEKTVVKESTSDEECGWVSTNCCPSNAGANWECVNTEETVIECPDNPVCPQVVVGEPTGNCVSVNGTCTAENTSSEEIQ